jgi:hypothetical protein
MFNPSYFERLVETVTLIVRHPEYPTKWEAVERCRHELAELRRVGRITAAEAEVLLGILDDDRHPSCRRRAVCTR